MKLDDRLTENLRNFFRAVVLEKTNDVIYKDICERLRVAGMYYDMNISNADRYRNHRTGELVFDANEVDKKIILYDSGKKSGVEKVFNFYYDGYEYVHAFIEFEEGVAERDIDMEFCEFMADVVYIVASRHNMQKMLEHAELSDALTGIPNIQCVQGKYYRMLQNAAPQEFVLLRMNLKNFKYVNEVGGAQAGDEAIIQYAHKLVNMVDEDECAGRLGGDNFVIYIHKDNLKKFLRKVSSVKLSKLKSAPRNRFDIGAWVGVSELGENEDKTFLERLNEANIACGLGKGRLNQDVVYYGEELERMIMQGRSVIAAFPAAVKNHEFMPFFQAKVDMRTGELVGFEALCRWFHDGRYVFPDQFIPVLDNEGLITELDMAIFNETCIAIKRWKEMGLNPPRISTNFSKKNLFIPNIEDKILRVIEDNGVSADDVEIEITESMKDIEYERLIRFVSNLKERGLYISIDDFGTGYSSLSLLHNIEADVIKIDKSFTDVLTTDPKSVILVESIVTIAKKMNMSIIAEGVETKEQGKILVDLGCNLAQGYYYSKPIDYHSTTELLRNCDFEPVV
ncbi:MAG: bifunctional diguanylate cyclase/phosphodiesterase [Eubacterium sp.]|nr:bifunctional diguanylate cyclase/phosphodiesterase [Eubacterium sp.]